MSWFDHLHLQVHVIDSLSHSRSAWSLERPMSDTWRQLSCPMRGGGWMERLLASCSLLACFPILHIRLQIITWSPLCSMSLRRSGGAWEAARRIRALWPGSVALGGTIQSDGPPSLWQPSGTACPDLTALISFLFDIYLILLPCLDCCQGAKRCATPRPMASFRFVPHRRSFVILSSSSLVLSSGRASSSGGA